MQSSPTLILRNNLPFSVRLSLLNALQPIPEFVNSTRQFLYNMSCEGFSGTDNVRILAKLNSAVSFTTYNVPISNPNLQTTTDALNTLQLDTFYSFTVNGIPYITVFSNTRTYSTLRLLNLASAAADANYSAFISENTTGSMKIYANCIEQLDFPYPITDVQNFNHPFGTKIRVVIVGGNNPNPNNYVAYNISSPVGPLTSGVVAPGETFEYTFVIDIPSGAFDYDVTITDSV